MKDRRRQDMQDIDQPLYQELTETILGCCFDVKNELGVGFLESVYKNALLIALREKGINPHFSHFLGEFGQSVTPSSSSYTFVLST